MMISSSTPSNPDRQLTPPCPDSITPHYAEEAENAVTSLPEENNEITLELPEPDSDNITVLTDKSPNKPILPWNHYDSPWEDSEIREEPSSTNEEKEEE